MTSPLPSFVDPPVTEVVVSARFKPIDRWRLADLGPFAVMLADEGFVREEQRPGFDAPSERFGPGNRTPSLGLELIAGTPPLRYWFLNDQGDELLQAQSNWFACNWRKVTPDAVYGRWESRWEEFERWIGRYEAALSSTPLAFDQVEITYVNHITPNAVWTTHSDGHKVFQFLSDVRDNEDTFLPIWEQASADLKFVMNSPNDPEEPLGRLGVSLKPGYQAETPVFVLTLTARGRPVGGGLQGVKGFADLAHEWIVRGFTELTTAEMHTEWRRVPDETDNRGNA